MPRVYECPYLGWAKGLTLYCEGETFHFPDRAAMNVFLDGHCASPDWNRCENAKNLDIYYERKLRQDMQRNVDIIKKLRHELGRYQKKVADQSKLVQEQQKQLKIYEKGLAELNRAMDDVLLRMALDYGEPVRDEETGEALGYRLYLRRPGGGYQTDDYEVHTQPDEETGMYLIGAVIRKQADPAKEAEVTEA